MKSELEKALIDNGSSIFAGYIKKYKYEKELKGAIYIPSDLVLREILSDLGLNLAQFEGSDSFEYILKQHLIDTNVIFRPSVVKGKISIDGLSIVKAMKVGSVNINFIDGLLLLDVQVGDLRSVSGKMAFGLQIFLTFDKKYKSTKIFKSRADEVWAAYRNNQLTKEGFDRLMTLINDTNEIYDSFVERVKTKMEFLPITSSGGTPVVIGNATDWADAIGELNFLVREFQSGINPIYKNTISPENLEKECSKKSVDKCDSPCSVKKSLLGKQTCNYPK
jgi:hypothetical protein